jgi:hypothetical protein
LSFFGALSEVEVSKPCINIPQRDPGFFGLNQVFLTSSRFRLHDRHSLHDTAVPFPYRD